MEKNRTNAQSSALLLFLISAMILSQFMNVLATPEFIFWFLETHQAPFAPDPGFFVVFSITLLWVYAFAGWRMWCYNKFTLNSRELLLYLLLLSLMIISVIFKSSMQAIEVAFIIQILTWFICLATVKSFLDTDKVAGMLMILVLLWISFETYLYAFLMI